MPKVTFVNQGRSDDVLKDGVRVAIIGGTRNELWLNPVDADGRSQPAVARFKYMKPRSAARKMAKFLWERLTTEEIVAGCAYPNSPLNFAKSFGFVS